MSLFANIREIRGQNPGSATSASSPLLRQGAADKSNGVKKQPAVAVDSPALSFGLRRYLYFTSAINGAAIMIVEILGAKLLAPFVGTSHFVWTAQIAVTLVALSAGYYAGGRLADRSPKLQHLYIAMLFAAAYLCLAVLLVRPVAFASLQLSLATGSLVAAAFLFFIPLALLAMTGPFLIRTLIQHVNNVGGSVGRLSAISTLGSVAGTVLIGYVLIPFLPNSITMFLTAGLLAAVSTLFLICWNKEERARVTAIVCIVFGGSVGYAGVRQDLRPGFADYDLLFRGNSNFGRLEVIESDGGGRRLYLNDYLIQNTYDPATKQSLSLFSYMLHGLAQGYTPKVNDALCIGMGVGIVPMDLARDGARVEVVEINPAVVPVAQQFFGCETNRFQLTIGDGRQFLNETKRKYDAVVLDAFLGDSSPSHLMTREAFASMRDVLRPEGTLVINCFGGFDRGRDFFVASLDKTLHSVFASVRIHATGNGNVFFVASPRAELKILHPYDLNRAHPNVKNQIESAFSSLREVNPSSGRVLTDDFNPVEFYDAANRERFRRDLAEMARSL